MIRKVVGMTSNRNIDDRRRGRQRRGLVSTAVLALVGVVGAGVAVAAVSLPAMTVQKSDTPTGYSQKFSHRLSVPAAVGGARKAGYVSGWQRGFARLQGVDTAALTSTALEYTSRAAAHNSVTSIWRNILGHSGAKRLTVGRPLGDEARAFVYQTTGAITTYAVSWRYKNINGIVLLVGLRSIGVTAEAATRLAVRQQEHIRQERG